MKKRWRQTLALLLCLSMAFSLLCGGAWAANPNKTEKEIPELMATGDPQHSAHMWYQYNNNIDIRGYKDGQAIQTTYEDIGYETVLRCGDAEDTLSFSGNGTEVATSSGLTVTPTVSFSADGSYAIVRYVVTNPTNERKNFSLGVRADVDISTDDYATVTRTANGVKMVNTSTNTTYYLICRNISGMTSANTMWIGEYPAHRENVFSNSDTTELTNTDSTVTFSWSNKVVTAHSCSVFAYEVGIGDSGSILDYTEEGKGFTIGEDTNQFQNVCDDFFNISSTVRKDDVPWYEKYKYNNKFVYETNSTYLIADKKDEPDGITYHTSNNYFNRLVSGLGAIEKMNVEHNMNKRWDGSCRGIAITMALASQGINLSDMGISTNYANTSKPVYNHKLRDAINFYQTSQCTPRGADTKKVVGLTDGPIGYSLHDFLVDLQKEGIKCKQEKKPFIFSYSYYKDPLNYRCHTIVAYGYDKLSDNKYDIKLYDENAKRDFTMNVDLANDKFSFDEVTLSGRTEINQDHYKYLGYNGIDDLYGTISTMSAEEPDDGSTIMVSAYKKCKITNDKGETLLFDGEKYAGTMNVRDIRMVGEGKNLTLYFSVDPYTSLKIDELGSEDEVEVSAGIRGDFYTASVDGASAVSFTENNIQITGENYTFSAGTSAGTENAELVEVSAQATGDAKVTAADGTVTVNAADTLSNSVITSYNDTDVSEHEIDGNTNHVSISDTEGKEIEIKPTITEQKPSEKRNITDPSFDIYVADDILFFGGETETYVSVYDTEKEIYLEENVDYKLTYQNNKRAGTATVIITGIGNYTGETSRTFTIYKGNNYIYVTDVTAGIADASSVTRKWSAKQQTIKLDVFAVDNPKLTYKSSDPKNVAVNASGKVTVKARYTGKATLTITAPETGTYKKTTKKFTITVAKPVPKKPTLSKVTNVKGKKLKATWKKVSGVSGYEVQFSTAKNFKKATTTKRVPGASKTSFTSKALKKKKKYYVRVRTYITAANKKNYPSAKWSNVKTVTIKK